MTKPVTAPDKQNRPLECAGATRVFTAEEQDAGMRLDIWLTAKLDGVSRTRAQTWIAAGCVRRNKMPARRNDKIRPGDSVFVEIPPPPVTELKPEPIPLAIMHEDYDIIVLNKPPGLVMHPSVGHASGTLVNALLHHPTAPTPPGPATRPGIVHRLDRYTSGLVVVAKNQQALAELSEQFKKRAVMKKYTAIVWGTPNPSKGVINAAIARSKRDRKKMAVAGSGGRAASTAYSLLEALGPVSLLDLGIKTGRTHQIRVHLTFLGHPVLGDPQYGTRSCRNLPCAPDRQMLHASELAFTHPASGEPMTFMAPMPPDMISVLTALREAFA